MVYCLTNVHRGTLASIRATYLFAMADEIRTHDIPVGNVIAYNSNNNVIMHLYNAESALVPKLFTKSGIQVTDAENSSSGLCLPKRPSGLI